MAEKHDPESSREDRPAPAVVPAANPEAALAESPVLDNAGADEAVDDIVAHEADEVLAADDEDRAARPPVDRPRHGFWYGVGVFFRLWLGTARGRWLTFAVVVAGATTVGVVPAYRYSALNAAGVRAGASVAVVDGLTQLPLKNVRVTIGGRSAQTDAAGMASFGKLRLGPAQLHIEQPGFSGIQRTVVLGLGSNPLGPLPLQAVGVRYALVVYDWLTGKPLPGVQATSGDATALSGQDGKVEITFDNAGNAAAPVTLTKDGYRPAQATLQASGAAPEVQLVPAQKVVFVDKTSGNYDLYQSDLDGAEREVLLPGTGQENGEISLVQSPDGSHAAIVSTRDGKHDADGFLESTLTLVDLGQKTATTLAQASQIQLVDWVGTRLVFKQVSSDPATPPNNISTVIGYDYAANSRVRLAAAPVLSTVLSAQGSIFYAVAASDSAGAPKPGLYRVDPDGTNRQTALDQTVLTVLRTDYNTLAVQTTSGWTAYLMPGGGAASTMGAPASPGSRLYVDNADHTHGLWVSDGTLMNYDVTGAKDTAIQKQDGLNYPLQWLDGAVLYRVSTDSGSADYVTSLQGGTPRKVADTVPTGGFTYGQ
ncbi:MAG TPA: hypothetical protein VLF71_03155 [Candidatus Saccharimonadales bacterium]|nr:hypothetical protein [Candidatus Saccharimonadales bacterium]